MNFWADERRTKMKKAAFFAVPAACAMCSLAAFGATTYKTNQWVGATGGDWGEGSNWSLGHVPADDEMAYFDFSGKSMEIAVNAEYKVGTWYVTKASKSAPLTFKGTGKILHNGYSPSPYIYNNHPFTLDGVTFDIGNFESLWYSPVTLRNGGTFITTKQVYLWNGSANMTVDGGAFRGGNLLWAANVSLTVGNGEVSCANFDMYNATDDSGAKKYYAMNMSLNEGAAFSCSGNFNFYQTSSLTMDGGSITTKGAFNVEPEVSLNLLSGAITNNAALHDKRFVTENRGVAMCIKASGDKAVFFDDVADGDTLTFNAPFHIPNGYFSTTNTLTLKSGHPFETERFYYPSGSTGKAYLTLRLSQIISGAGCIFNTASGSARSFRLEGTTVWRPTVEIMNPAVSRTVYPQLDGELVIDTRDWNDPSLARSLAIRNLGSANGNGALVVRGGGEFSMTHLYSYFPYRHVKVEEGTTLTMLPYENSEYAPLNAMKITLEANATLKIPGGTSCVAASGWEIDPTARIVVDIPAGTPAGGLAVLRDFSGKLADCSDQVVLTGDGAEGWSVHFSEGTLSAVKSVGEVDGKYTHEWTGANNTDKWADALNWYGGSAPVKESKTTMCAFGAADSITVTDFNISGSYLGQLVFRNSAIKPFAVTSAGERTFFMSGGGDSSASVFSESAVPQYIKLQFRRTGASNRFSFVSVNGPTIIDAPVHYPPQGGILTAFGDVRVKTDLKWPQLGLYWSAGRFFPSSHLAVMDGATVTVANQTTEFKDNKGAFIVHEGGVLRFLDGGGGFYRWSAAGAKHIINGTMSLEVPLQGGKNQVYGGKGTLEIARNEPYSAAASLVMQDGITLDLASDWLTVADGADFPHVLAAASFSAPTLRLNGDWTYGPAADASTQTAPSARALDIGRSATLTVDAGGHSAEFADPVAGEGTLAIANGTLRLAGGVAPEVTVKLAEEGMLEVDGELAIGKLEAAGGALKYKTGGVLECAQIDDVSRLEFDFPNGAPGSWTTVLVSSSPVSGEVAHGGLESRVLAVDGGYALQCRKDIGFRFIVR